MMRLVCVLSIAAALIVLLSPGCGISMPQPGDKPAESWMLETVEHRGHLYVKQGAYDGHFIHSPECKCQKRRALLEDSADAP